MKSKSYIHYGHTEFNLSKFQPIKNRPYFNKPTGGLWASPVNAKMGWKEWNEGSGYRECQIKNSFIFSISNCAKVFDIFSVSDLQNLPLQKFKIDTHSLYPDFEKMLESGYDAIELHLSEEKAARGFLDGLYFALYGWDCDSILILSPKIILS